MLFTGGRLTTKFDQFELFSWFKPMNAFLKADRRVFTDNLFANATTYGPVTELPQSVIYGWQTSPQMSHAKASPTPKT